jgi:hypothetical protein
MNFGANTTTVFSTIPKLAEISLLFLEKFFRLDIVQLRMVSRQLPENSVRSLHRLYFHLLKTMVA